MLRSVSSHKRTSPAEIVGSLNTPAAHKELLQAVLGSRAEFTVQSILQPCDINMAAYHPVILFGSVSSRQRTSGQASSGGGRHENNNAHS